MEKFCFVATTALHDGKARLVLEDKCSASDPRLFQHSVSIPRITPIIMELKLSSILGYPLREPDPIQLLVLSRTFRHTKWGEQ